MHKKILRYVKSNIAKPTLLFLSNLECYLSRKWASAAHRRLYKITWRFSGYPEFFDHHIDVYHFFWQKNRSPFWLERGVFNNFVLKRGGEVLEIACGDGFFAKNFYSKLAGHVLACDFDKTALDMAITKNGADNVNYSLADIRKNMPAGKFDNIIFDAAIEHFTDKEIPELLADIKKRLNPDGILSGYTIVSRKDGRKSHKEHEYEFSDKNDLKRFFTPFFKNVIVFETIYPERHNLYFWASDGILPAISK